MREWFSSGRNNLFKARYSVNFFSNVTFDNSRSRVENQSHRYDHHMKVPNIWGSKETYKVHMIQAGPKFDPWGSHHLSGIKAAVRAIWFVIHWQQAEHTTSNSLVTRARNLFSDPNPFDGFANCFPQAVPAMTGMTPYPSWSAILPQPLAPTSTVNPITRHQGRYTLTFPGFTQETNRVPVENNTPDLEDLIFPFCGCRMHFIGSPAL